MTNQTSNVSAKAFKWDDANTEQAMNAYLAAFEEKGIEFSNSKEFLTGLANELGAKSSRSIMSKLSTLKDENGDKVYRSLESAGIVRRPATTSGKPAAETKAQTVDKIAKLLNCEYEDIHGLDRAKGEYLDNLFEYISALFETADDVLEDATEQEEVDENELEEDNI